MTREAICPTCGRELAVDVLGESPDPDGSVAAARTIEVVIPSTMTSVDDLALASISLASPAPDSVLGSIVFGDSGPAAQRLSASAEEGEPVRVSSVHGNGTSRTSGSGERDPFAQLDLGAPRTAPREGSRPSDEYDYGAASQQPARWPWILLGSYASALTLACLWVVFTGRVHLRSDARSDAPLFDVGAEAGQQADRSVTVNPAPPIAKDHVTSLKHPIRLGSLEFTPLGVQSRRVSLERAPLYGRTRDRRDGGADALVMRIRLRNVSDNTIFAPFDEGYVRERDRGFPESFIETGQSERIYIYPLAAESEWSIVGQTFPALKPAESAETILVSAAGVRGRASDPMTWRLRLRTGVDETALVGVQFRLSDIGRDGD